MITIPLQDVKYYHHYTLMHLQYLKVFLVLFTIHAQDKLVSRSMLLSASIFVLLPQTLRDGHLQHF